MSPRLALGARLVGGVRHQSGLAAVRWEDGVAHSTFPAIDLRIPATTRLSEFAMRNFERHGDKLAIVDGITGKSFAAAGRFFRPSSRPEIEPRAGSPCAKTLTRHHARKNDCDARPSPPMTTTTRQVTGGRSMT